MDSENINELLEKYWNCQTSVEEEKQLQDYFKTAQVADFMKETAAVFLYFQQQRAKSMTDRSFDAEVMRKIRKPKSQVTSLVYNTMRIAAGIVVLVLAVWLVRIEIREGSPTDTYSDPDRAFEETKKALMMISKSFNTAEQHAKKINLFNEAQDEIRSQNEKTEL